MFALPGMGQHFIDAALARDYGIIMPIVIIGSMLIIFFNFLVDVLYAVLDPRVRVS